MPAGSGNLGSDLARELAKAAVAAGRLAVERQDLDAFDKHYAQADHAIERLGELLEQEAKADGLH